MVVIQVEQTKDFEELVLKNLRESQDSTMAYSVKMVREVPDIQSIYVYHQEPGGELTGVKLALSFKRFRDNTPQVIARDIALEARRELTKRE